MRIKGSVPKPVRKGIKRYARSLKVLRLDRDYTPVFLCGVAGSGTTLLGALLDERFHTAGFIPESAMALPPRRPLSVAPVAEYASLPDYHRQLVLPDALSTAVVRRTLIRLYQQEARIPKETEIILDKSANTHLVRTRSLRAAFPDAKFVLIFRDPVANIEGLRRKWPLFARASLSSVCDFWEDVHATFLTDTCDYSQSVGSLSYETLVATPEPALARVASLTGLTPRAARRTRKSLPNERGKALRNVVDGEIAIVRDADREAIESLTPGERDLILEKLRPTWDALREREWTTSGRALQELQS